MRAHSCVAGSLVALLLFGACTKQMKDDPANAAKPLSNATIKASAPDPDGAALHQFLIKSGPAFETFTINAQEDGLFRTRSGNIYTISHNSLAMPDGSPVGGPVTVYVKEISTPANMIFADRQTATNTGIPLASYGEYFVRATQGGIDLQLRKDSAVKIQVPAGQTDIKQIPMWNGDTTVTASLSGYNYINQYITVTMQVSANKGIDWQQVTNPASAYALFDGTNLNIRLDSLIKWTNCDRLNPGSSPKTTVLGYFTSNYNPNTATSFTGEEPSMLFFKPSGQNTIIKFYNTIFNAPAGFQGFLSYQNTIPVGLKGTFLAISSIGGVFYADQQDVTIPAPPAGQNYVAFKFNPSPVSPGTLAALITSMNTK
ncbi:hypothetical protein [Chitinophaga vietnamensis]|uniref:hypothetical protein n=1 Tax=Chitinophaga vietnamensis TaxID=2593957 RepID=UPI001177669B|nr:hypothetical protein [Chitinophaga vietnamensis]